MKNPEWLSIWSWAKSSLCQKHHKIQKIQWVVTKVVTDKLSLIPPPLGEPILIWKSAITGCVSSKIFHFHSNPISKQGVVDHRYRQNESALTFWTNGGACEALLKHSDSLVWVFTIWQKDGNSYICRKPKWCSMTEEKPALVSQRSNSKCKNSWSKTKILLSHYPTSSRSSNNAMRVKVATP